MMRSPAWAVAGTSVPGPRRAETGEAGQDRHRLTVTHSDVLIAIVSDGAGSAPRGGEGAQMLCEHVGARLELFFDAGFVKPCNRATLAGACRAVRRGIADARDAAVAHGEADGMTLDAYHATLVGAAMIPGRGGLFFHIGDGAALAYATEGGRWQLSAPSNGEYADTTYFFTEARWRHHLRFSVVDASFDTVFLMTDGVTDLAFTHQGGGAHPHLPFFEPIGRFLASATREDGERALTATLDSSAARERTSDDKTLLWARALP